MRLARLLTGAAPRRVSWKDFCALLASCIAVPAQADIAVDGHIDEPAWQEARPAADFWQRMPQEGQTPTYGTEVRVLYDDEAIYVAVRAEDREPGLISSLLTRYDEWTSADWIVVGLDTYRDRRTAFQFAVNAGGTKFDELLYDDTRNDSSWNAVWEGIPSVDDRG
jgi:hypothetical protein